MEFNLRKSLDVCTEIIITTSPIMMTNKKQSKCLTIGDHLRKTGIFHAGVVKPPYHDSGHIKKKNYKMVCIV